MRTKEDFTNFFTHNIYVLEQKQKEYGDSWKKRGGVGAFMMLARKWDRIELAAKEHDWNIFEAIRDSEDSLRDDINDLINYLKLTEQEVPCAETTTPVEAGQRLDATGPIPGSKLGKVSSRGL